MRANCDRSIDSPQYVLCNHHWIMRRGNALQDHNEFVATQATDNVLLPGTGKKTTCGLLQHLVTDIMSVPVTDRLEAVEVNELHGARIAGSLRHCKDVAAVFCEPNTVRQSGQTVMQRCLLNLTFGALASWSAFPLAAPTAHGRPCPPCDIRPRSVRFRQGQKRFRAIHACARDPVVPGKGTRNAIREQVATRCRMPGIAHHATQSHGSRCNYLKTGRPEAASARIYFAVARSITQDR